MGRVFVTVAELLPEAAKTGCWGMMCLGFIVGVVVMVATHLVLHAMMEDAALRQ